MTTELVGMTIELVGMTIERVGNCDLFSLASVGRLVNGMTIELVELITNQ